MPAGRRPPPGSAGSPGAAAPGRRLSALLVLLGGAARPGPAARQLSGGGGLRGTQRARGRPLRDDCASQPRPPANRSRPDGPAAPRPPGSSSSAAAGPGKVCGASAGPRPAGTPGRVVGGSAVSWLRAAGAGRGRGGGGGRGPRPGDRGAGVRGPGGVEGGAPRPGRTGPTRDERLRTRIPRRGCSCATIAPSRLRTGLGSRVCLGLSARGQITKRRAGTLRCARSHPSAPREGTCQPHVFRRPYVKVALSEKSITHHFYLKRLTTGQLGGITRSCRARLGTEPGSR